jgi:phage gp46-like protein
MPDIRLVQRTDFPYRTSVSVDWLLLGDGTLDDTQALASAVIVALGTDRLAEPDDILPDPDSTDRRGWWGDYQADVIWNAPPIGSRLWLLHRSKITGIAAAQGATLTLVQNYISEAIQPFVDQKVCSGFEVIVQRIDKQRIDALIRIFRGPLSDIELRYQILWNELTG